MADRQLRREADARRSLEQRKVSIPFDSLGDGFSEFDDDDLPPSKRKVSEDFERELTDGCMHTRNGPLTVELTIPQSRHKPEVEARIIDRFRAHFGWRVESTRKARWATVLKGMFAAPLGTVVLSFHELLQQIPFKPVQFNFDAEHASIANVLEVGKALHGHLSILLFKAVESGVEILGWFLVFYGLEKLVSGREQFKKDIGIAKRLRDAEWLFTSRTRPEQKSAETGAASGRADE
jgi:hypothetical protein